MADPVTSFTFDPRAHLPPAGLRGLWRLLHGFRLRYLGAMMGLFVSTVARTSVYLLLRVFVDDVVGKREPAWYALVAAGFVGLALVQAGGSFVGGAYSAQASEGITQRLRNYLYRHIQSLSFGYHDRMNTGELIQRVTGDVETVRGFYGNQAVELGRVALLFAVNLAAVVTVSPTLALVTVVVVPPLAAVSAFFFRAISKAYEAYQEQDAKLTTTLQENLSGVRVVKAFARQQFERGKFETDNAGKFRQGRRLVFRNAAFWPLTDLLSGLQLLAGIVVGSIMVIRGGISLGGYLAYIGLVGWILWPVRMVGRLVVDASKATVSYGRLMEIIREEPEAMAAGARVPHGELKGEVSFRGVSFRYGEAASALEEVSFDVRAGQVVALLGPTGSGKTTLVNLLPRFYEYSAGSITLDGVELREYAKDFLRDVMGTVEQQPFLFSTTIAENIAYGVERAVSREEIQGAARAAAIHEGILEFPQGYDTLVGEKGVTLSGGQKQRVAIARALLRDPRILILDDATSSVDAETEQSIWEALERLMRGRTTFIIAHRIQTLMRADLIVVLQKGRVVQRGRHADLVAQPGIYRTIYELQSRIEVELEEELAHV
jgi:ATP-binding cassette subfamily B protein